MKYDLTKANLDYDLKCLSEPNNTLNDYGDVVRYLLNEVNELKQLSISRVVSSATYNADHLWKKATEFTYALEKNGYLACLEDLEKAGIIELKNIDKNN